MQFNTRDGPPSTWERYGSDANHDGTKDIYGTSRLSAPCAWVMAFAVLPADCPAGTQPGP